MRNLISFAACLRHMTREEYMYKKQLKFQKIVCFILLIASALVFVYSLGMMTDLHDSLRYAIDPEIPAEYVKGAMIYYDMQGFNRLLTIAGIALILVSLLLFVTNTHSRRKYYIGNYVSVAISSVANVGVAVWAVIKITAFKEQYLTTVDFEALKIYSEKYTNVLYTESTFWFDVCYFVMGLVLVATVLSLVNLIWKIRMMKAEKRLIEAGKGEV